MCFMLVFLLSVSAIDTWTRVLWLSQLSIHGPAFYGCPRISPTPRVCSLFIIQPNHGEALEEVIYFFLCCRTGFYSNALTVATVVTRNHSPQYTIYTVYTIYTIYIICRSCPVICGIAIVRSLSFLFLDFEGTANISVPSGSVIDFSEDLFSYKSESCLLPHICIISYVPYFPRHRGWFV